jgi:PadR family transcriptional regulator PadR
MDMPVILLSRAEEIILVAVYKRPGSAYGVTIREQIYEDLGRFWSFGVIYRALKKMTNKGYLRKCTSDPISERGGRSRYYYEITARGLRALKEIQAVQFSVWDGMPKIALEKKSE